MRTVSSTQRKDGAFLHSLDPLLTFSAAAEGSTSRSHPRVRFPAHRECLLLAHSRTPTI